MKKALAILITLTMLLSAAPALGDTNPQAQQLAKQQVPMTAVLTSTGEDDTHYEFIYEDKVSKVKYEVTLNKNPLSVREVASRIEGQKGSDRVVLKPEEASAIISGIYQQANITNAFVQKDNNRYHHLVTFNMQDDNTLYLARLNASTGDLLGLDIKSGAPGAEQLRLAQAMQAAIAQVPGGLIVDVDYETDDGVPHYEIEVIRDGMEYEVHIDAQTGAVLYMDAPEPANAVVARDYRDDMRLNDDDDDDWYDDDDDEDDDDDDDRDDDDDDDDDD